MIRLQNGHNEYVIDEKALTINGDYSICVGDPIHTINEHVVEIVYEDKTTGELISEDLLISEERFKELINVLRL